MLAHLPILGTHRCTCTGKCIYLADTDVVRRGQTEVQFHQNSQDLVAKGSLLDERHAHLQRVRQHVGNLVLRQMTRMCDRRVCHTAVQNDIKRSRIAPAQDPQPRCTGLEATCTCNLITSQQNLRAGSQSIRKLRVLYMYMYIAAYHDQCWSFRGTSI